MKKKNINSIKKIFKVLNSENYQTIQYYPANFSYLAFIKEFENLINTFFKKKHLIFYFSLIPSFYLIFLNKRVRILRKLFFLNKLFDKEDLKLFFDDNSIKDFIKKDLMKKVSGKYRVNYCFVPYKKFIYIRDQHQFYDGFFDPKKSRNKVWMGADSIIFLKFLNKYLEKNNFRKALEIGSGSGIVINSISNNFNKCEAIDLNNRAIKLTFINSVINNVKNLKVYKSNLFKKVKGKFNIIISNPWYVDLKKGGLEVAPSIIKDIDKYLEKGGVCLLIMNSYIKKNLDPLEHYFYKVLKSKNYDINMYTNGCFYESNRSKEYKKYKVEHAVSYNVEIKTNGEGTLKIYKAPILRRIRDFTYLKIIKLLN